VTRQAAGGAVDPREPRQHALISGLAAPAVSRQFHRAGADGLTSLAAFRATREGRRCIPKVNAATMRRISVASAGWLKAPPIHRKLGVSASASAAPPPCRRCRRARSLPPPPYDRRPAGADDAAKIRVPCRARCDADTRITSGGRVTMPPLTAAKIPPAGLLYPGAQHGFHNDTTPSRVARHPAPPLLGQLHAHCFNSLWERQDIWRTAPRAGNVEDSFEGCSAAPRRAARAFFTLRLRLDAANSPRPVSQPCYERHQI